MPEMKRLLIWGAGPVGQSIGRNILEGVEVIGFLDNNKAIWNTTVLGKNVYPPEKLISLEFDYIVISTYFYSAEISRQIAEILKDKYDVKKVLTLIPVLDMKQYQEGYEKLKSLIAEKVLIDDEYMLVRKMRYDTINDSFFNQKNKFNKDDYPRFRTFELAADEVIKNGVEGAVAELGVFTGNFAQYISHKFSDRDIYLFDTFASFDEEEFNEEKQREEFEKQINAKEFFEDFKNTDLALVLNKMANREKTVVCQGFFPKTAEKVGKDVRFAFVSIDVDLEESIYAGLEYFYPRMNEGGYIFVHDYNNILLTGVKKAVERYQQKYGRMKIVPLADVGGTLVIVK